MLCHKKVFFCWQHKKWKHQHNESSSTVPAMETAKSCSRTRSIFFFEPSQWACVHQADIFISRNQRERSEFIELNDILKASPRDLSAKSFIAVSNLFNSSFIFKLWNQFCYNVVACWITQVISQANAENIEWKTWKNVDGASPFSPDFNLILKEAGK